MQGFTNTLQARVTVAEALPLLRGRIKAPTTCVSNSEATPRSRGEGQREDDSPEATKLTALKGQVLSWELCLQNAGTCPHTPNPASDVPYGILLNGDEQSMH